MASYSLYPPVVDSYIPAFLISKEKFTIQFRLSDLNSDSHFENVQAVIYNAKSGQNVVKLQDNSSIGHYRRTGIILNLPYRVVEDEYNLYEVDILQDDILSDAFNKPGLTYKIQLRLSKETYNPNYTSSQADWISSNAGSFSEWSTALYTTSIASIDCRLNLDSGNGISGLWNSYPSDFLFISGTFTSNPSSEVVEEYYFILYDENEEEVERSEVLTLKNTNSFEYSFFSELENHKHYYLTFHYTTRNYYEGGFDKEKLTIDYQEEDALFYALKTIEDGIAGTDLGLEQDEGYIAFKIRPTDNNNITEPIYTIDIRRSDSESLFKKWITIKQIIGNVSTIEQLPIMIDNTIESGVFYQYKLQIKKVNEDSKISRSFGETQKISRDFEDTYLIGKDHRQLKLRFNNTLGNYVYQVVESKQDTIGGRYPIITRNTASYYRSFTINGLISFQSDEQNSFYTQDEIYGDKEIKQLYKNKYYSQQGSDSSKDINLDIYDIYYEKKFREKVIEFLYDGKIKLFKSPTEGNILVRLMNVSLNPNQSLGRMLYTFSCTAYEIGEVEMEVLKNNGLVNFIYDESSIPPEPQPEPQPEPDYRKGYIDKDTIDSAVEIIDHKKEVSDKDDMTVEIINAEDIVYHTF